MLVFWAHPVCYETQNKGAFLTETFIKFCKAAKLPNSCGGYHETEK